MRQIMLATLNSLLIGVALGLSAYWATQAEGNFWQAFKAPIATDCFYQLLL